MRIILICILISSCLSQTLQDKIKKDIKGFEGQVGVYVKHLTNGQEVKINADTIFPTASMIKVPIMLKLFDRIEAGDYEYNQKLKWYADSIKYPYDGQLLWSFKEGQPIHMSELISLMITYSDNHASLWCQKLSGGGEMINEWLDQRGFKSTRMNSRTKDRRDDWKRYGWGQTTPYEMAQLIVGVRDGKWVSSDASAEMYRILSNIYWRGEMISEIPPKIMSISKQGSVNQSRSEVILVNAPNGDYVVCVITQKQKDSSWTYENAGFKLLRKISSTVWQHFEPDYKWKKPNTKKYRGQYDTAL